MKNLKLSIVLLILIFFSNPLQAQDFVYEPKNPSFGGNTFNYQWMLSSAQVQNKLKEPEVERVREVQDPLADFQNSLNRQILGQLSRQLVLNQFGSGGNLEPGEFTVGNFQISITEVAEGVSVVILDTTTGNQTTVVIPFGG